MKWGLNDTNAAKIFLPRVINQILCHSSSGHFVFDVAEGGVVLAEVVRHVAVGVDAQQLGAGVDQELDEVQVTASGRGMLKKKSTFD